ncbi:MAG: glycosyltransferase family 4 protein [Chitinivibrionales bacterium]|nr:glycosyltransferase family 4 protein [Chitinivibrionales bacterium]
MQKPENILFLVSSGVIIGGGQISLLELVKRLDKAKFTPFFVLGSEGSLHEKLRQLKIDCAVVCMPAIRITHAARIIRAVVAIGKAAKARGIRLIHSNDTRAHSYAGIVARILHVPNIFHFRVSYSDGVYDLVLPLLATKIAAVSAATAKRFARYKNKTEVIYNGVDCDAFCPLSAESASPCTLTDAHPLLGTIGRLEKAKGMDAFIRLIAALKPQFPAIGGIVVGEGPQKAGLRDLSETLGLQKNVVFVNRLEAIRDFMSWLDLYVLLSDNEGLNRSIMEAMACGKCVVATDVGGNPELIADESCGRLVPFGDTGGAARAAAGLLKNEILRASMGVAARKRIEACFTIESNVYQTEKLFSSLQ